MVQKYIELLQLDRERPIDLGHENLLDPQERGQPPKALKGGQVRLDELLSELVAKDLKMQESVRKDVIFTK